MPTAAQPFAWNDVALFLALARARTMSDAARSLGVDTSTVSRRLVALEETVGARLFERGRNGLRATAAADDLVRSAEWAEEAVMRFARRVDGLAVDVSGVVRVACPPDAAVVLLLPVVERLRANHPQLTVTLVPGEATLDLGRRDADLALRVVRPTRGELVFKRLGEVTWVPAANAELAERARADGYGRVPWVAWEEGQGPPGIAEWMARHAGQVALRTSHLPTQFAAVARGIGAALLPAPSLAAYGLRPITSDATPAGSAPLFLVAQRSLRETPRVSAVWDAIVAHAAEAL